MLLEPFFCWTFCRVLQLQHRVVSDGFALPQHKLKSIKKLILKFSSLSKSFFCCFTIVWSSLLSFLPHFPSCSAAAFRQQTFEHSQRGATLLSKIWLSFTFKHLKNVEVCFLRNGTKNWKWKINFQGIVNEVHADDLPSKSFRIKSLEWFRFHHLAYKVWISMQLQKHSRKEIYDFPINLSF